MRLAALVPVYREHLRDGNAEEQDCNVIRQLPDRDAPGVVLETEIQRYLRHYAVHGAVEDPSAYCELLGFWVKDASGYGPFDSERKDGKRKVRTVLEEDMGHEAVASTFPF